MTFTSKGQEMCKYIKMKLLYFCKRARINKNVVMLSYWGIKQMLKGTELKSVNRDGLPNKTISFVKPYILTT